MRMHKLALVAFGLSTSYLPAPEASALSLQMWLRADVGVETQDYSGSGGDVFDVTSWRDQSGRGNDVSQASIANMPELVANGLNDNPVVRFSGEGDTPTSASPDHEFLTGFLTTPVDLNRATVLAIGSFDSPDRLGMLELSPVAGNYGYVPFNRGHLNPDLNPDFFSAHYDGDGTGIIRLQSDGENVDTAHHLFTSTVDKTSGSMDLFLDGIDLDVNLDSVSDSVFPMDDATHVTVGARQAGEIWWLGGDVGEIIVFDDVVSSDELAGLHHILGNRWGISTPIATAAQISAGQALLVPEPSTALLLGLGLIGFAVRGRRVG